MDRRIAPRAQVPAAVMAAVAASLVVAAALVLRPSSVPIGTSAPSSLASSGSSVAASEPTATDGSTLPPGVVAWIDATPAPSPPPSERPTAGLPTCSADALDLRFTGWNGAGGSLQGGIVMSEPDASAPMCVLSGVATVSFLNARGRTMAIDVGPIPNPSPAAVVIEPGLSLPPEHEALLVGQAGFSVYWSNWCGPDPGPSATLVVGLPGSGTRRLAIDVAAPRCDSAADRSVMTVTPIEAAEAPEPSPPPWADLAGHAEVPSVVVAGETLHYLVTLRNNGDQPVPLDPCPAYVERLWSGNSLVAEPSYLLNCAATSPIQPGSTTTFEMVLDIPADAPPGSGMLLWGTDGPGPSSQKQPITIAPPGSALGSVAPATVPPTRDELDLAEAKRVATAFESARAGGDWQTAWQLLSPFSQKKFGSVEAFIRGETAYNSQGGSTFVAADPTRSGDLIAPEFLGTDLFFDLKGNADIERAWFVGITHPDVPGASAGSEGLVVAPLRDDGAWRVWVR
jgi:hypothetical protein